jgi:hypothetical protein
VALRRLAETHREAAGEEDERPLLLGVDVSLAPCTGLATRSRQCRPVFRRLAASSEVPDVTRFCLQDSPYIAGDRTPVRHYCLKSRR